MSQWWVGRRGADPVGPVSTETLVRGVKEKKVPPNALVCRVGEQQWLHVSQVDELWDKINPEEAPTAITEKPWFKQVDSSPPVEKPAQTEPPTAADKLADADDDDDATRIYDSAAIAKARTTEAVETAQPAHSEVAAESPTVPLVTATTSADPAAEATLRAARSLSKIAPAKAAAPSFRAPASLTQKAAARDVGSPQAIAGTAGAAKEVVKTPKAVIPAPRFGVDRVVPASPIAAGEFLSKPPSVRPEPMANAAAPVIPPAPATPTLTNHQAPASARTSQPSATQTARRTADPAHQAPSQALRRTAEPALQSSAQPARRPVETGPHSAVRATQPTSTQQIAHRPGQSSPPPAQTADPRQPAPNAPQQTQQQAAPRPGQSSPPPAQQPDHRLAARQRPTQPGIPRPGQSSPPPAQQVPRPASNPPAQEVTARAAQAPAAARQTGSGQARPASIAKTPVADKSRQQPIPPVPAAVIPLPEDSDIAAMVRDNVDISLVETRPDRRAPTGPQKAVEQAPAAAAVRPTANKASAAKPDATPQARPPAGAVPVTQAAPIVVRPIVNVAEPDDDDATVIRHAPVAPVAAAPVAAVAPAAAPAAAAPVAAAPVAAVAAAPAAAAPAPTPMTRGVPLPDADDDDDITIAREVPSIPPQSSIEDEDATVIKQVNPTRDVPSLDELAVKSAPPVSDLERLAARSADANRSGERPIAPAGEHHAPIPPAPPAQPLPAVVVPAAGAALTPAARAALAQRLPADMDAGDLYDADDEALPARAKDYAGAHGPPSSPESTRPRPAAGTPLPPSVIIAPPHQQHHVPVDALGRVIQPHSEATHPALRTIRPPGTIQISVASLIVGAMTLIVIVLAAVLLLR